ncbi:MAG TPA: hypothetical protein VFN46_00585 [Acetobacteraceae bacterium]|nr:hypothetical protein [Acetobacteraceae bacterium]
MKPAHGVARLLALVALALQLAAASIVLPASTIQAASVDQRVAASICAGRPSPDGTRRHPHLPRHSLVPLCQAVSTAGALLTPAPPPFAAAAEPVIRPIPLPPARAPPALPLAVAYPRGPPVPV